MSDEAILKNTIRMIKQDVDCVESSFIMTILSNRGFHSMLFYRIANLLYKLRVPILPLALSRIIQVLYGIDIDYRARLGGGIVIVHGIGLVIGQGVVVDGELKIYHGVTLGIANREHGDGFPYIKSGVLIGAGAKVLGNVTVGENVSVGANAVVTKDVPPNHIAVGVPAISHPKGIV